MAEAGFPSVDVHLWSGIFAAAATPPAAVAKLQKALDETIRDPGVSDKLKALAVDPGGATPEEFKRIIASDIVKFGDVVKAANLHFDE
jgi:tripartite-type tricarboxylate transporter receptor subunit TctC